MTILTNNFLTILNMSYAACFVIAAALAVRLVLAKLKAPRIFCYALWAVVLFRLLCPISFETALSLVPSAEIIPPQTLEARTLSISSGIAMIDEPLNAHWQSVYYEGVSRPVGHMKQWAGIAAALWLAVTCALLLYNLRSLQRLKRRLRAAEPLPEAGGNVWQLAGLSTAFVLGVWRPQIYLPADLNEAERNYILLHEQTHLRRGDNLFKLLGFGALLLHWFNPLVWLAFRLAVQDMEMACDETVLGNLQPSARADYSATLLRLAAGGRVGLSPLAFSEGGVKSRIKNALNYRKPALWLSLAGLAAVIAMAVLLAGNPSRQTEPATVEGIAENFMNMQLDKINGLEVETAEITRLEQLAQFEDFMLEAPVQVWELEYRFKPADINNVPLVDFQQQDGWITASDNLNRHLLVVMVEQSGPQLLGQLNLLNNLDTTAAMESATRQLLEYYRVIAPETWPSSHAIVQFPLSDGEVCQLLLSQPARQGEDGIWCVERWLQGNGNLYYVYPPAPDGVTAKEYYEQRQAQCDEGHQPWQLEPLEVAWQFISEDLGQGPFSSFNRSQLTLIQPASLEDFAEPPESHYFGYILDFELYGEGRGHFNFDYAEWVSDTDAARMAELGLSVDDMPSGFYIHNPEAYSDYVETTPETQYIYITPDYPAGKTAADASEFAAYLNSYPAENRPPFHVVTMNGFVTQVREQYVP